MTTTTPIAGLRQRLSDEEIGNFRRDGWALLPGLLSGEALAGVQRLTAAAHANEDLNPSLLGDRLGVSKDQASGEYQKTLTILRNPTREYPLLEQLSRDLGKLAAQTLRTSVRFWGDQIMSKPPIQDGSAPTSWHQDLPKLPVDRRGYLTFWIAINDVPVARGPLTFLPGSHRLGPLGVVSQLADAEMDLDAVLDDWDRQQVGEPVTTALKAGDATLHDGLTLHRAARNDTDQMRHAWAVEYIPADTLYTGAPRQQTDGLGLVQYGPFEHDLFPVVASA